MYAATRGSLYALLLLSYTLLQGCVVQQWQSGGIGGYLDGHTLTDTLTELESQTPYDRDRPMYLLNRGLVHHLAGNYQLSNQDLEAAKMALQGVQALSITEGFTSSTINETFNDYSSTDSERVLLHVVMALNYLALQDLPSARVEVLQSDLRMRESGDEETELASARFIAGLVFELNSELSDAMISYRKAEQVLTRRQLAIPTLLQDRLLSSSRRLGLDSEHLTYLDRFQHRPAPLPDNHGEVLVLYLNGKVSDMYQRRISIYAPSLEHNVTISQAFYPPRDRPLGSDTTLAFGDQGLSLELIEDVDTLAREALQASQGKRMALSLARVTTKHQLVKSSREQDPLLGFLADLASILTEVADTRSWSLLPATIQVGTIRLPAGTYSSTEDKGPDPSPLQQTVEVKAGATQLLIANSYGYQAAMTYN
ncbi:MAG: hypothetical protein V7707_01325 [Motiliproteus sp.]